VQNFRFGVCDGLIPSVTGTQLLRTNKTRKAKKQTTVLFEITHSTTPAIFL